MIREDDMSVCGEGSKEGWEGGLVLKEKTIHCMCTLYIA